MKTMPFDFPEDTRIEHIQRAYKQIDEYRQKVKDITKEGKKLSREVALFGIERTKKKEIKICRKHLKSLKLFWDSIALVTYNYEKWKQQPW